jgi:hypothetical protein
MAALHITALCAAFTAPTFSSLSTRGDMSIDSILARRTVQRAPSAPMVLRHSSMPEGSCRAGMPLLQATPPPTTPQPTPDEQQAKLTKLLVSILIDLIGVLTYAVPAIGEVGDLAWAPISALLIYNLYGNGLVAGSTCRKRAPVSALQLGASAS